MENTVNLEEVQKASEGAPQTAMPAYISHKKVWALKIAKVHFDEHGQGVALQFAEPGYMLRAFTHDQLRNKPTPQDGMYFVQYQGGYFSFSPAEAFEFGYTREAQAAEEEKDTLTLVSEIVDFSKSLMRNAGPRKIEAALHMAADIMFRDHISPL